MGVGSQAEQVSGIRPLPYRALLSPLTVGDVLPLQAKRKTTERKYPPLHRAAGTYHYKIVV